MRFFIAILTISAISFSGLSLADKGQYQALHLYLDADQSGSVNSGRAIRQGVELALQDRNNSLHGIPLKLLIKDHKGNSRRSKEHLNQYLQDDSALAVITGMHSPPLLTYKNFINQNRVLVLDPWAAAGPITRSDRENWIFRLSVDDTKGGAVISEFALKEGFKAPFLLLEDTGWGRSNRNTMNDALRMQNISPQGTKFFSRMLTETSALVMLRDIKRQGRDVIFLVANAPEAKAIAKAMLSLDYKDRLPIRSHWGLTGGDFAEALGPQRLASLDLKFIQTRHSFLGPQGEYAQGVLDRAIAAFSDIKSAKDIKAPTGFIHSYDLMNLFLNAAESIELSGDIEKDRLALKNKLENLTEKHQGLIKTYQLPFRTEGYDSHEALGKSDYVMGYYDPAGVIHLIPASDE